MPNWCSNYLQLGEFKDPERKVEFLKEVFTYQAGDQLKGWLPGGMDKLGWWFEVYMNDIEDDFISYQTKHEPCVQTVIRIADLFGFDFTLEYEEPNSMVMGAYKYKNGILKAKSLSYEEYDSFSYEYVDDHDGREAMLNSKKWNGGDFTYYVKEKTRSIFRTRPITFSDGSPGCSLERWNWEASNWGGHISDHTETRRLIDENITIKVITKKEALSYGVTVKHNLEEND